MQTRKVFLNSIKILRFSACIYKARAPFVHTQHNILCQSFFFFFLCFLSVMENKENHHDELSAAEFSKYDQSIRICEYYSKWLLGFTAEIHASGLVFFTVQHSIDLCNAMLFDFDQL